MSEFDVQKLSLEQELQELQEQINAEMNEVNLWTPRHFSDEMKPLCLLILTN